MSKVGLECRQQGHQPDDDGVDVLVDVCAVERAGMASPYQGQRLSLVERMIVAGLFVVTIVMVAAAAVEWRRTPATASM
jgi:hypothetical protein